MQGERCTELWDAFELRFERPENVRFVLSDTGVSSSWSSQSSLLDLLRLDGVMGLDGKDGILTLTQSVVELRLETNTVSISCSLWKH